jgi:hypothetical protein
VLLLNNILLFHDYGIILPEDIYCVFEVFFSVLFSVFVSSRILFKFVSSDTCFSCCRLLFCAC